MSNERLEHELYTQLQSLASSFRGAAESHRRALRARFNLEAARFFRLCHCDSKRRAIVQLRTWAGIPE